MSAVRPVVSRRALLAKLENDRFDESETSTPNGAQLDEHAAALERAYAKGWNDCARNLYAFYALDDVPIDVVPISDEEAAEIRAIEEREAVIEAEQEHQERKRLPSWAFEFDVEQDAISDAYNATRTGEGG